jgi:PAS domain S-box-containing protein
VNLKEEIRKNSAYVIPESTQELNHTATLQLARQLKTLTDESLDVICQIDKQGRFVYVSAASIQVWGYAPDELLGKKYMEMVHPDDHAITLKAAAEIMQGVDKRFFENRYIRKDGGVIPVVWSARWEDADESMYCIARDATEQKRAEQALKVSEEHYKVLFMSSPLPMWIYEVKTLRFLEVNEAAIKHYGYSREEFLSMTLKDIRPAVDVELLLHDVQKFVTSGNQDYKYIARHIKKNGELIFVEIKANILDGNDPQSILVVSTDITDKIEAENDLIRSKEEIQNILESIRDGFFALDNHWMVTYWNHEAERLFKISKAEAIGNNLWSILGRNKLYRTFSRFEKAFLKKETIQFVDFYKPSQKWLELRAYTSERGLSVYVRDITEKRRREKLQQLSRKVLERNAVPDSRLEEVVAYYLKEIEKLHEGMFCSVLKLIDNRLYNLASPQLPESYTKAINGVAIGPMVGSCGTAAYWKEKVVVSDIANDPHWEGFRELALPLGLAACWSIPIIGSNNVVIGTFAIYHQECKSPSPEEENTIEIAKNLLLIVLENKLAEQEIRKINERYHLVGKATNDIIWDWDILKDKVYRNEERYLAMLGYRVEDIATTHNFWVNNLHPDDAEWAIQTQKETLANPEKEYWECEYRFRKIDGTYVHLFDRGYIVRNGDGVAVRMIGATQNITARKKHEEELQLLSLVAKETVNAVVITNAQGRIEWVNDGFTKITGYELKEVVGRKPGKVLQGPETDKQTVDYLRDMIAQKEPFECEIVNYNKSGKPYWMHIQGQPVRDDKGEVSRFFAIETDITKQKQEEHQLKLLESVITHAKDGVVIFEVDVTVPNNPNVIFVNDAMTQMTGYVAGELYGNNIRMLHGTNTDPEKLRSLSQAMARYEVCSSEIINYKKSGEEFWCEFTMIPVADGKGIYRHWISIQRDSTKRKKLEEEREVFIRDLTLQNSDLKQFSYITSHNLRAPVTNLMGLVCLLKDTTITDPYIKELFDDFKESTRQLNEVITDLVNILIIKNGVKVQVEEVDISQLFNEVLASAGEAVYASNARIYSDFTAGSSVTFNPGYMQSVLLNLLTNAIKYRSPTRQLQIQVSTKSENGTFSLEFSDNGLGIDLKRYGDRVFGLYQRFHNHPDSKGMGLYLIHSQIRAMGAELTVSSEEDKGTTFTIIFSEENNVRKGTAGR